MRRLTYRSEAVEPSRLPIAKLAQRALLITGLVCGSTLPLSAQDDQPGEEGYENAPIAPAEPRGATVWAVPLPGETFDAFTGTLGHSAVDMVLDNGGPLSFNVVRRFEPVPAAWSYEFGTMSLSVPTLKMMSGSVVDPRHFTCSDIPSPGSTSYSASITFQHESGTAVLVHHDEIRSISRDRYPDWAQFISTDHYLLSCASDVVTVHAPDGSRYEFNLQHDALDSYDSTKIYATSANDTSGTRINIRSYQLYATKKRKLDSELGFTYEVAPDITINGEVVAHTARPPVSSGSTCCGHTGSNESPIQPLQRKVRLKRVLLTRHDDARAIDFTYRTSTQNCPGLIETIESTRSRVAKLTYRYGGVSASIPPYFVQNDRTRMEPASRCVLKDVIRNDGSTTSFDYGFSSSVAFSRSSKIGAHNRFYYLPLRKVHSTTGAVFTYGYRDLATCEYQDTAIGPTTANFSYVNNELNAAPSRCLEKRPALTLRQINGSDVTRMNSVVRYRHYGPGYTVSRLITNSSHSHRFTFHRALRVGDPWEGGVDGERMDRNRRLASYELLSGTADSSPVTSRVDYTYSRNRSFTKSQNYVDIYSPPYYPVTSNSADTPYGVWPVSNLFYSYGYDVRDVVVDSRVETAGDPSTAPAVRTASTLYDSYDGYSNPTIIRERQDHQGAAVERTTSRTYDYANTSAGPGSGRHNWQAPPLLTEVIESGQFHAGNPLPLRRSWTWDRHGRLKTSSLDNMSDTVYDYGGDTIGNPASDLVSVTDGRGLTTQYRNYRNGIAREIEHPDGSKTRRTVDAWGNITSDTDPEGITTTRTFDDEFKRLTSEQTGSVLAITRFEYPLWGTGNAGTSRYKTRITRHEGYSNTYASLDALGRETRVRTAPANQADTSPRDQRFAYDLIGNRTIIGDVTASSSLVLPGMRYTFDNAGRVASSYHSTRGGASEVLRCYTPNCFSDPEFSAIESYLDHGYAVKDQDGFIKAYNYRTLGRLDNAELVSIHEQVGDASGGNSPGGDYKVKRTTINRNLAGFVTSIAQGFVNGPELVRTFTPYRDADSTTLLLKSESHPDIGSRQIILRDQNGNVVTEERFDGSRVSYTFDSRNRLTLVDNQAPPAGINAAPDVHYQYFTNNALKSVRTGPDDTEWSYTYDGSGLLQSETLSIDGLTFTTSYVNGPHGLPVAMTYPTGRTVSMTRNDYGQLVAINGVANNATYLPTGQLIGYQLANGATFNATFDVLQRPDTWAIDGVDGTIGSFNYDYDRRGNVTDITGYFNPGSQRLSGARYDGVRQLLVATGPWGGQAEYAYDGTGNLTHRTIDGERLRLNYAAHGKLTGVDYLDSPALSFDVNHDANGNVVASHDNTYRFNQMNQLVRSQKGSVIQTNEYDGHGLRVRRHLRDTVESGGWASTTYTVYSQSGQLIHEYDQESGEERDLVSFGGKIVATLATHTNHDSDQDGLPDWYERLHGLYVHRAGDATDDADGDGLSNFYEYRHGSSPTHSDSDRDSVPDAQDADARGPVVLQPVFDYLVQ